MSENRKVEIGIQGNASGLTHAVKDSDKALDVLDGSVKTTEKTLGGLDRTVKGTGKTLGGFDRTATEAGAALGTLGRDAQASGNDLGAFERRAEQASRATTHLGRASQSIRTTGKVLSWGSDKIINQYTALAGGAGLGLAVKKQIDYQAQLQQMMINARDATTGQVGGESFVKAYSGMDAQIKTTSMATGVSMGNIAEGIQRVIDASGDFDLAKGHMKDFAETAVATGSDFSDVAMLANSLVHTANLDPSKLREFLNVLVTQGKTGALTMKDYATEGPRMFTVMSQFGKLSLNGLYSFGALQQVAQKATADPAMARTAILTMARDVAERKQFMHKMKEYNLYVKNWDTMDMADLVKTMIVKAKGDARKVMPMFTGDAQSVLMSMANDYKTHGSFTEYDSFVEAGKKAHEANKDVIGEDFLSKLGIADTQIRRLSNAIQALSSDMLASPLDELTDGLKWINAHGDLTRLALEGITGSLVAMAGVIGYMKLATLIGEFNAIRGAGKKGAGALGEVASASTLGIQRVYVVNLPGGMGGTGGASSSEAGVILDRWGNPIRTSRSPTTSGTTIPTSSRLGQIGRRMAPGALMAATGIVASFADNGNTVRGWGGALGSAAGTALGSFGGPIGMMIGSQIGATAGPELAEWLANAYDEYAPKEHKTLGGRVQQDGDYVANGTTNRKRWSDAAPSDQTSHLQRVAAEVNKTASANGDFFKHISLNVETHVASDGTAKTNIWGENADKIPVSTGFFKEASDSLGSLTPSWAGRR